MKTIPTTSIKVIPQSKNANAYALDKLAYTKNAKLLEVVAVEFLAEPNIKRQQEVMELI